MFLIVIVKFCFKMSGLFIGFFLLNIDFVKDVVKKIVLGFFMFFWFFFSRLIDSMLMIFGLK